MTPPRPIAASPRFRWSRRAFTLIELVVVLFCMVVAAATVIPRFSTYQRASQARDLARSAMAMVRDGREIAVEKQRPVTMDVSMSPRGFVLRYDDTLLPPDPNDPNANSDTRPREPLTFPEPLTAAINLPGDTLTGDTNVITFTPEGRVPDADILIQYTAARALRVSVRRQGTLIQAADAANPELPLTTTTPNTSTAPTRTTSGGATP